jgi:hypothetical protein
MAQARLVPSKSEPSTWPGRQPPRKRESRGHYYGDKFFSTARADTLTTLEHLRAELAALQAAGTTDVVLYPASGGLEQVSLLADALRGPDSSRPAITDEQGAEGTALTATRSCARRRPAALWRQPAAQ